jgi:hypothetical protein
MTDSQRIGELKSELTVLEAFGDSTRAKLLKSMLEYELQKAEVQRHDNSTRRSS